MLGMFAGYLRRHHVGLLALFLALGGTAYAATLPRNSVGPKQLKRNAVTSAKVRDGALKPRDFAAGTLLKGDTGARGATGPRGLTGAPGSDAQFTGAAAGGDLTGTYPNPTVGIGPSASVNQAALTHTVIDNDVARNVPFAVESYDTVDMHDNFIEAARFTIERTGVYLLHGSAAFAPDPDGERTLSFVKNDNITAGGRTVARAAPADQTALTTTSVVSLNAGDFVTLRTAVNGAGQNLDVSQGTFTIQWLGPVP